MFKLDEDATPIMIEDAINAILHDLQVYIDDAKVEYDKDQNDFHAAFVDTFGLALDLVKSRIGVIEKDD